MAVDREKIKKMVEKISRLTVLEFFKLMNALRDKLGLGKVDAKPEPKPNGDESDNGDETNGDESDNGDKHKCEKDGGGGGGGGGGEKDPHNNLKNYIAENPSAVKLNESLAPGETEQRLLPTEDKPDVLFQDTHCRIAVEVKSHISGKDDLERGFFQCVKYKALLEARRIVDEKTYEVDAILAIEHSLPEELKLIRDKLDIKVIENVRIK